MTSIMNVNIVFVLVLLLSSASSQRGNAKCSNIMRRNSGRLSYRDEACESYTWKFIIPPRTNLLLTLSAKLTNQPILIQTRSSNIDVFETQRQLEGEASYEEEFDSSVAEVALIVPGSRRLFVGRYKLLSRPQHHSRPPCRLFRPYINRDCSASDCIFSCKQPDYIPHDRAVMNVSCVSERDWREAVRRLCIPRIDLKSICFEDSRLKECNYNLEDFMNYFQFEESLAGDEAPTYESTGPRTSAVISGRMKSIRELSCLKNRNTGRYIYSCEGFGFPNNYKRCLYWRYLSTYCKKNSLIFSG